MEIVYTHHSDPDVWYAPYLACNEREEKIIKTLHGFFYGKDWYCTDPLGHKQILYIMLDDLPLSGLWFMFVKKTHRYIG